MQHETLLVIDFGSQVTQLIARRVRELGVFAEIVPCHRASERLAALGRSVRGIVLSGGPSSIYDDGAPTMPTGVLEHGVPVLGICYGLYAMVHALGGQVARADEREYGAFGDGTLMFCGTLAAIGGIRPAERFDFALVDPVLDRRIEHGYDVTILPIAEAE